MISMAVEISQKYDINLFPIETILSWVTSNEIGIPEIQRPFVWEPNQVKGLIDSLYNGYPIGYIVTWKDPAVTLKDGKKSDGKKIIIDGQQRVKALMTSILGETLIDADYKKIRIQIAFNPVEQEFAVINPAKENDMAWIPEISPIVNGELAEIRKITDKYIKNNPNADEEHVLSAIDKVREISKKQLGVIELHSGLDIETITEIFVRVNQEGVKLNKADFVMAKIASFGEKNEGSDLRKCIDLFCHLAVVPDHFEAIKDDVEFSKTDYFKKISWLKDEKDDFYDPDLTDVLRVAFATEFERGKLGDLLSLLAGRNFETKEFEDDIKKESFKKLIEGVLKTVSESNFKRFLMIINSAGFVNKKFYQSVTAVNIAYVLYLKLKEENANPSKIEKLVKKWFVMSTLTGRYSVAIESRIDSDVKYFKPDKIEKFLDNIEKTELSDAFWNIELVNSLSQSNVGSSYLGVFRAARIKNNEKGFLSKDLTVRELVMHRGDDHHIFPRDYLKRNGKSRRNYNQLANFVYTQQEINIQIGSKPPKEYMAEVESKCNNGDIKCSISTGIDNMKTLKENLKENCIPESIFEGTVDNFESFLKQRRKLMAEKIKEYYYNL